MAWWRPDFTAAGSRRGRGFTLIELAAVLAAMALLTAGTLHLFRNPVRSLVLEQTREQLAVLALLEHRRMTEQGAFTAIAPTPSVVPSHEIPLDSPELRALGYAPTRTGAQFEVRVGQDGDGPWFVVVARIDDHGPVEVTLDSRQPGRFSVVRGTP